MKKYDPLIFSMIVTSCALLLGILSIAAFEKFAPYSMMPWLIFASLFLIIPMVAVVSYLYMALRDKESAKRKKWGIAFFVLAAIGLYALMALFMAGR